MCEICVWNIGRNDMARFKPNTMRKTCPPFPLFTQKNPILYALICVTMLRVHSIKL